MSLPFTRRIAKAALLTAAGAASVVGAAGSASAMDLQHQPTELAKVSNLDGENVGQAVDGAARNATGLGETGHSAVESGVPAAKKTVGDTSDALAPTAERVAGGAQQSAGTLLSQVSEQAAPSRIAGTLPHSDLNPGDLLG